MKKNIKKEVTVKLKDGRCFKAHIVGKAGPQKVLVDSDEWGEMVVDARCVKN
jgi:N-methylhydantoinase A/oxoprolinase/acetone carboxylase beta subunit